MLRFSSLYRRLSYAAPGGRGRRRSRRPYILHLSPCRPLLRCTRILMVWLFVLGTGSEIWASGGAGAACATCTMITTLITQQAKSVSDIFHPFLFVSRKLHTASSNYVAEENAWSNMNILKAGAKSNGGTKFTWIVTMSLVPLPRKIEILAKRNKHLFNTIQKINYQRSLNMYRILP